MSDCGSCGECCRLLEIEEIGKPWNTPCIHQRASHHNGCCSIYERRPVSCGAFRCLWLASQTRVPGERLDPWLRPDKTHVVFYRNGGEKDPRTIFAHVDPRYPEAWTHEPVASEVSRLVDRGAAVIVVIGKRRIALRKDRPPLFSDEERLAQL